MKYRFVVKRGIPHEWLVFDKLAARTTAVFTSRSQARAHAKEMEMALAAEPIAGVAA